MSEFRKYAGGDSAKIVVIPTAMEDNYLLNDSAEYQIKISLTAYGFKDITISHTRDSSKANNCGLTIP
jgi:cyanophycinase